MDAEFNLSLIELCDGVSIAIHLQLCLKFTTENVIKCAFSIDSGCFNKEEESEFIAMGKAMFEPSFWAGLKFLLMPVLPGWALDLIPIS